MKYLSLMNLQENIDRIKSMMGLNESKLETIQSLIDRITNGMKNDCQDDDGVEEVRSVGDIHFEACRFLDSDELKVVVFDYVKSDNYTLIYVNITISTYLYVDEDYYLFELTKRLKPWIGNNKVIVGEYNNIYPESKRQW